MNEIFKLIEAEKKITLPNTLKNYYKNIDEWRAWWQGYVSKFHKYEVVAANKKFFEMERQRMNMAKTISEDWANLLLNDKTYIITTSANDVNTEYTQNWLSGDGIEQNGGVLGANKFWKNGNKLIEKTMALGTTAMIIGLKDAVSSNNGVNATGINIEFINDTKFIIPISWNSNEIIDCALASNVIINSKEYIYIRFMTMLNDSNYEIVNRYYEFNEPSNTYTSCKSPEGTVESYILPCKPFFIFKSNLENNIVDVPLGVSQFGDAISQLKGCDLAYDNLFNDLYLGRKKVFMNQDSFVINKEGTVNVGASLESSLYTLIGKDKRDDKMMFQEYNPALRVQDNKDAIELNLNLLSMKCGLGQKRYKFDSSSMATATEVKSSNKDLTESVAKQRIELTDTLTDMTRNILILGKQYVDSKIDDQCKITIKFDDTMFSDEDSERARDMLEVNAGLMQPYEFRMKWYGEDEETAKSMISETVIEEI